MAVSIHRSGKTHLTLQGLRFQLELGLNLGLKARKGGEEMYISNSAAFNMRIKVTIFTRPLKGSNDTEVRFRPRYPWIPAQDKYLNSEFSLAKR